MKRRYSDDERASALAALDANGGDFSATARSTGVPRTTLIEWANGRAHPAVSQIRQGKRGDLADELEGVAWKLVRAMPGKIDKAGLQQVAVSLGISVEKMRLLRELPTNINRGEFPLDLTKLTDDQLRQFREILVAGGFTLPGGT
jgi:hypothetical protein